MAPMKERKVSSPMAKPMTPERTMPERSTVMMLSPHSAAMRTKM